ncbi:unnamed protein product [Rotaria sordida]|uniref:Uncharacterized protein n=1 Tax=Rotaria sordida TaxID=392033 RepID=A0A814LFC6_9BILA|nr:unnamed protein product [Rotaria sordida]CAF1062760.1 unnamed protein product [Rotaria sordida]
MMSNDTYIYMDESSIHHLLKCKLCSKPFVDPVSTQNGERFCRSCISHILNRDHYADNEYQLSKMQTLTPVTETLVLEMLDSLLVQCKECEKINIPRGQLDEHKNKECLKATVLCQAADIKCSWVGTRESLKEHLNECKFEPLRSALEEIFNEHDQLKNRINIFEIQTNELMNKKNFDMNGTC